MKTLIVAACALALVAGCNAVAGIEPATLDDTSGDLGLDSPTDPTAVGPNGACDVTNTLCNNKCVAQSDPAFGCGSPTCSPCNVHHATAACKAGACVVGQCAPGFADCNGDPSDGCETDLSSAATCGACNVACSGSNGVCARGSNGGAAACSSSCPSSAPTQCDSTCTDLRTDPNRCGSCGNVCPTPVNGTATCSSGRCGVACAKGSHSCSGACVSSASIATCGPSCSPCPAAANATPTCDGVGCGFTCNTGFANCDKANGNGCEVSLLTDSANCGVCGHVCTAPTACVNGACQ